MIHYADTYGSHKFLFGTDWSAIDPERAVKEIEEVEFKPSSKEQIMRENALRIFQLPKNGLKKKLNHWQTALSSSSARKI